MNPTDIQQSLPSPRQLWSATALAIGVAAVLLVTVILPAEYGMDPIGAGRLLGLTSMRTASESTRPEVSMPVSSAPLVQRSTPFRTDDILIVLKPGEGVEIKATMKKLDQFVYSWTAEGGPVDFDMHGEEPSAPAGEFTSFSKKERQSADNGSFVAPFDGIHGWYWENKSTQPVTIRVRTSGFYEKLAKQ
jgi:hypothetical protein